MNMYFQKRREVAHQHMSRRVATQASSHSIKTWLHSLLAAQQAVHIVKDFLHTHKCVLRKKAPPFLLVGAVLTLLRWVGQTAAGHAHQLAVVRFSWNQVLLIHIDTAVMGILAGKCVCQVDL